MVRGHDQDPAARSSSLARRSPRPPRAAERRYSVTDFDRVRSTGPISRPARPAGRPRRSRAARAQALDRVIDRRPGPDPAHPPQPLGLGRLARRPRRAGDDRAHHPRPARGAPSIGPAASTSTGARGLRVDLSSQAAAGSRATAVDADNLVARPARLGPDRRSPARAKQLARRRPGHAAISTPPRLRADDAPRSPPTPPATVALAVAGTARSPPTASGRRRDRRHARPARSTAPSAGAGSAAGTPSR